MLFRSNDTATTEIYTLSLHDALPISQAVQRHRVELAPVKPATGTWMTPVQRDPLEIPIEEKVALLLATNEAALKVDGVRFVNSSLALLRENKTLVTSEGTNVTQTFIGSVLNSRPRRSVRVTFRATPRNSRLVAPAGSTSSRCGCR